MRLLRVWTLAAVAGPLTVMCFGDTLVLNSGIRHNGTFVSGSRHSVTFQVEGSGRRNFNISEVRAIEFSDTGVGVRSRNRAADVSSASGPTLPAGTELKIRTNERITSENAIEGRVYSADVVNDVTDSSGSVAIPRGSQVELGIAKVSDAGTVSSAELALDLRSISVNGQRYLISTAPVGQSSKEGIGKNRRTAEMLGGGAALGAVIGAIAGGGKGAVIGAIVGAAGGGAAQVLTRGKKVEVPPESVLTFRLDQSVQLQPANR